MNVIEELIATGPVVDSIRARLNVLSPIHTQQEERDYAKMMAKASDILRAVEQGGSQSLPASFKTGEALGLARAYIRRYSYVLPS